jgi:para-nitrobenzyl esterase
MVNDQVQGRSLSRGSRLARNCFSAMTTVAILSICAPAPSQPRFQTLSIENGRVAGTAEGGVESWKGIPFARPPVGALRWRAPQPVPRWRGVFQATAYKHDCMQLPFPSDAAPLGTPPSEDCLYLNVWRPSAVLKTKKLPVLVWIHGGGFVNGGSSAPTYSGANLAKQGVLVVGFNYRLGRFGTFVHPALLQDHGDHPFTGNFGSLDQIAALKWVRRNISAFGGDPDNVTIVGESAGGMSVHMLLTSPATHGLFARAVIMSGGGGGAFWPGDVDSVRRSSVAFAVANGISATDPMALAKLRALPPDKVVAGLNLSTFFEAGRSGSFIGPYADGIISVDGPAAYASGHFAHVPVMIGATSADLGGKSGPMIAGAHRIAAVIADQGVPVYEYRFSYVADSIGETAARHASDIPFFFDTTAIRYGAGTTAKDVRMGKAMSRYLVNFAKTGNPNGRGLATWPVYAPANDILMNFGADGQARAERDPVSGHPRS